MMGKCEIKFLIQERFNFFAITETENHKIVVFSINNSNLIQ